MPHCERRSLVYFVLLTVFLYAFLTGCGDEDEELNIPPAPRELEHTLAKDTLSLRWQEAEYAETYRIYRGTQVDGDFQTIGTSGIPVYDDAQITRGSTYVYKITGVSDEGVEGDPSAPYQVSIPLDKPCCDVNPTTISFQDTEEGNILTIKNTGTGILEWEIQNVPEWLDLAQTSGQTGEEFPSEIQLSISERVLRLNETYAETLIIASNDPDNPERTVNVIFSSSAKVLIVQDLRSGFPIPGALLEIEGKGISDTVTTDASGVYAFQPASDGQYTISASGSGYMPKTETIDTLLEDEFEIALKPIPKVIGTIKGGIYPFNSPAYVAFSNNGNLAYVTNQQGNNVSVIDASSDRILRTIDVGQEPLGLVVNPRTSQLYVVNHGDNTVSVIDTNINRVKGDPIQVGNLPIHAAVNDFGTSLYVVNSGENTVSVIKLALLSRETQRISVGRNPYGVALSFDSRNLFVTNASDDSVSVVSTITGQVDRVVPVGNSPRDIAYVFTKDLDASYVLISNFLSDNLVVFDTDQMSVEIHELGNFPIGLAVVSEPDDSYTAYASIRGENLVRIFDLATMQVVDESIRVGSSPGGIAAHPDGHKIYVVNSDENSISVLGY